MKKFVALTTLTTGFAIAALVTVAAQQSGFRRTPLQQGELSIPGYDAVTALAEIDPNAQSGRHTHPGEEIAYVAQGPAVFEFDGQPARTLQTGEAILIKKGLIHNVKNTGTGTVKIVANWVVEHGKPVATPAP